ncbi:CU044_5270 family protein [Actinomadura kijaniata]|uniref:CU044_5270 family protein n=1 Tax=Actinomadura kijaniata TaxID=46161 RepID=UPI003F1D2B97
MSELKKMCDEVRPVGPDALAEGRVRLLAAAHGAGAPARRRSPRRGWAAGLVAVGAVAAAAGAVAVVPGAEKPRVRPSATEPVVRLASASEVLRRAADAAGREPDLNPRDDQYLHIRSIDNANGIRREFWRSVDGRKASVLHRDPCTPSGREACTGSFREERRPTSFYRRLPTDPKALEAWFRRDIGAGYTFEKGKPTMEQRIWMEIEGTLLEQYVPPKLRAAMFTVVSRMPGGRVINGITDPTGRPAVAVTMPGKVWEGGGSRGEIVFDRRTFQVIGLRTAGRWTGTLLGMSVTDTAPKVTPRESGRPRNRPGHHPGSGRR